MAHAEELTILAMLRSVNTSLCRPPLEDADLRAIAASACKGNRDWKFDSELLESLLQRINTFNWSYPGGAVDRAVFLAMLDAARGARRTADLGISTRRLALLAKASQRSAARSLNRLITKGS